ncbi:TIGR04255 family protein [Nostoc sp. CMAA1605]|uniref:TIGR04255 family protein n=1 Tax=Nostoc sp. CMAA1605 TaxID=2055159 RepID=UPI001F3AFE47|nr:TIGR04255 family protein [Nostoc sp. CMAA1605]MCF4967854.1 TIGR04255 family protein [Nostoc sp. CMAA1605]
MKLPNYERVIYERNPLIEVIAQLRFPTILRIGSQQPVEFQDNVRFEYPIFESSRNLQIPVEISSILNQFSSNIGNDLNYQFKSEDLNWQLSIDQNSITLATTKYERYEKFISKFKNAVEIFERIYNPLSYSRIGLRYRDLIIRSKLKIKGKEWSELIPEHIANEFYTPEIANSIQTFVKNLQLKTEFGQVNFNHGLVKVRDIEQGIDETAYLLDADFFTENKLERGEKVWEVFQKSNRTARNLFRWSITEELHRAMKPKSISM